MNDEPLHKVMEMAFLLPAIDETGFLTVFSCESGEEIVGNRFLFMCAGYFCGVILFRFCF